MFTLNNVVRSVHLIDGTYFEKSYIEIAPFRSMYAWSLTVE